MTTTAELFQDGEINRVAFWFDDAGLSAELDGQVLDTPIRIRLEPIDYEDRLATAKAVFDRIQDYLVENGPTRAEARPGCRKGHLHPAFCDLQPDGLYLSCPQDFGLLRRLL